MRKIIRLINLFFFLLIIPPSYSITLEELIDSYNYTYSSEQMNITNMTHYGNDTDGNGLYDYLIIDITVDNDEGNYTFIGDLYKEGELIATISDTYYLTAGENIVPLYYDAKLLQNGVYNLSLIVQENYLAVYREDGLYIFDFDNSLYEKPDVSVGIDGYEFINNDVDVKYEILRINITINSSLNGNFEINALIANSKTTNSKENYSLINGTNNINIDFDSKDIRRNRINNSRLYLIRIKDGINYEFYFNYSLAFTLYEFDAEQSILMDSYSDEKIDTNGNDLAEFLEINISLDINESGIYKIGLELNDLYDNYVKKEIKEFNLNEGEQVVSFRINGTDIYNSKANGPYLLEYVKLIKDNVTLDSVSNVYITNNYNYDEFERPLMPDLVIKDVELGSVKVSIANEGDAYAFAFNVELFDDDFNSIGESSVDYLAPGNSRDVIYDVNASNTSKLYAVVDYDNDVEENNKSNNLFVLDLEIGELIKFNISLLKGWNLISSPLNFTNITKIFNPIKPYLDKMFAFDGGDQKFIEVDPYDNIEVDFGYGVWLNVFENTTLEIVGEEFGDVGIDLSKGWNLIGYPSLNSTLINETLKNYNYPVVYVYNNSDWLSYVPMRNDSLNTLKYFKPGYGYLVWVR